MEVGARLISCLGLVLVLAGCPSEDSDHPSPDRGTEPTTVLRSSSTSATDPPADPPSVTRQQVETERRLWRRLGPLHYVWRVEVQCYCSGGLLRVTVRDRNVAEVRAPRTTDESAHAEALTVDDLFVRMVRTLEGGKRYEVRAAFDPTDGHPLVVDLRVPLPDGSSSYETHSLRAF
jgi:hypothetical protein